MVDDRKLVKLRQRWQKRRFLPDVVLHTQNKTHESRLRVFFSWNFGRMWCLTVYHIECINKIHQLGIELSFGKLIYQNISSIYHLLNRLSCVLPNLHLRVRQTQDRKSYACYFVCLDSNTRKGQKALPELCSRIGSDNFNIGVRSNMAAYGWKYWWQSERSPRFVRW